MNAYRYIINQCILLCIIYYIVSIMRDPIAVPSSNSWIHPIVRNKSVDVSERYVPSCMAYSILWCVWSCCSGQLLYWSILTPPPLGGSNRIHCFVHIRIYLRPFWLIYDSLVVWRLMQLKLSVMYSVV